MPSSIQKKALKLRKPRRLGLTLDELVPVDKVIRKEHGNTVAAFEAVSQDRKKKLPKITRPAVHRYVSGGQSQAQRAREAETEADLVPARCPSSGPSSLPSDQASR